VKLPKTPLTYSLQNEKFQEFGNGWQVGAPELGFMFPNFTNRGTDIYSVHYYSKKPETIHEELIHALFTEETPMSSVDQKALFHEALKESLGDSCDLDMYLGIQDRLTQIIDNSSEVETEKIAVKKSDIIDILNDCNADEEQIESFENNFDSLFGETEAIPVENLVEQKKMVVEASDIVIHVPADKTSCIEAKIIDNKKYILIRADSGFAINNFDVHI
jgi:hypothetical protein